jgi:hypothetical protein
MIEALRGGLSGKYPGLAIATFNDATAALAAMDNGGCDAAVLSTDAMMNAHRQSSKHCNKAMVGGPVFSLPNAIPVQKDLHSVLSWAIAASALKGWNEQETLAAKAIYWAEPMKCASYSSEADGQLKQMSVEQLMGPLVLTALMSLGGIVLHCFGQEAGHITEASKEAAKWIKEETGDMRITGFHRNNAEAAQKLEHDTAAILEFQKGSTNKHIVPRRVV